MNLYQRVSNLSPNKSELLALRLNGKAIFSQPTSNGDKRLVAYVVPKPQGAQQPLEVTQWHAEQISQWREVYDELYSQVSLQDDPTFNLTGWNSSYTGLPIPAEQMREQVDRTVERVLAMRPSRVLEIGCGTGLLLFRIAPHCRSYLGTDFSPVALDHVQKQLRKLTLPQVSLVQRTAEDFTGVKAGSFDMVILNSVVQYFPSMDYLIRVLEGAVKAVAPGGSIVVGDVRSLPLLEAFHVAVELNRARAALSTTELRERVRGRLRQEQELVIDPDFFSALQQRLPQIRHVEIQPKRGWYHNELTRFRYDVILQVGGEGVTLAEPDWLDWSQVASLTTLQQLLKESQPELLGLTGVPNARLQAEVKALDLLASADGPETVRELREALGRVQEAGVDPEELWVWSQELPYEVHIGWSGSGAEGKYDVLFRRREPAGGSREVSGLMREAARVPPSKGFRGMSTVSRPWGTYANNPLQQGLSQKLVPALRNLLREQLPDYMVPSAFVLLEALPLTPNGKLDRKALPSPHHFGSEMKRNLMAPGTELERTIANVWQEVLGVQNLGLSDNFFDLGGHSLLMVRLRSKLQEVLNRELSIIDLFQYPTVGSLAGYLNRPPSESGSFQPIHHRAEKQKQAISRLKNEMNWRSDTHE
jgi:SAM-dependent methyltransferase/acyl carrier protein